MAQVRDSSGDGLLEAYPEKESNANRAPCEIRVTQAACSSVK